MASDFAVAAASGFGTAARYAAPYDPGFSSGAASETSASGTAVTQGAHAQAAGSASASATGTQSSGGANGPPVNPSLHVDLALNVVVLEFYNAQGDVTQSIPSQKQLQAYELQPQKSSVGTFTVS